MRISDWSSDVCSSDLGLPQGARLLLPGGGLAGADARRDHRHLDGDLLARDDRPDRHALPLQRHGADRAVAGELHLGLYHADLRSEEHTSELQSLMRTSYAVFCLNKNTIHTAGTPVPETQIHRTLYRQQKNR